MNKIVPMIMYLQRVQEWQSKHQHKTDMRLGQFLMGMDAMRYFTDPEIFYSIDHDSAAKLFVDRYVFEEDQQEPPEPMLAKSS